MVAGPGAGEGRGPLPGRPERASSCPESISSLFRGLKRLLRARRSAGGGAVRQFRAGRFLQVPASLLRTPDDVIANPCKASRDAHICGRFRPQDAIIAPIPANVHVLFLRAPYHRESRRRRMSLPARRPSPIQRAEPSRPDRRAAAMNCHMRFRAPDQRQRQADDQPKRELR